MRSCKVSSSLKSLTSFECYEPSKASFKLNYFDTQERCAMSSGLPSHETFSPEQQFNVLKLIISTECRTLICKINCNISKTISQFNEAICNKKCEIGVEMTFFLFKLLEIWILVPQTSWFKFPLIQSFSQFWAEKPFSCQRPYQFGSAAGPNFAFNYAETESLHLHIYSLDWNPGRLST